MSQYRDLVAELEKVNAQIAVVVEKERDAAVAWIKEQIASFGLTAKDLGLQGTRTRAGRRVTIKYRNDATGQSWAGFGRMPKWLLEATDRDQFLVR